MKNIAKIFILSLISLALLFGCNKSEDSKVINVGATPVPHAEMLNLIVDDLAAEGYTLNVIEFNDYVIPNEAVLSGELDANFFQHLPYLESFNVEKGCNLVSAGGIHIEPMALYSKKYSAVKDLPDGAIIAVPNDPTNGGRAYLLLQSAGLIELNEKAGITATSLDIVVNPKNFKFTELEAPSLPRVLDDVDAAVINGNYALPAGLNAKEDGLLTEGADSPYVNIVAVKAGNENLPKIKALMKALSSEKIRNYINETYTKGEVIATF